MVMNKAFTPQPADARRILTDLGQFLKRPQVLEPAGLGRASSWKTLGVLYALHLGVLLLGTLPLTALIQKSLGLAPPDAFDAIPQGWLVPITVLIAPMLEEMLFRGWQSGRPRAFWLLLCGLGAGALLYASAHGMPALRVVGLLAALLAVGAGGWIALRRRPAPTFFRRVYPAIYWIVAFAFAGVHVLNYGQASAGTALLVLPQLWAGILLGYTRQRLGLCASMLEHAGANAATLALALVAGG